MDTVILSSTNYSGYTANITFNPLIGGTIALGNHQIPYSYTSDNIYGTYDLYFSSWTKTCSTSISPQLVTIIANTSTFSLQVAGTVSQINWGDGSPLETITNGQLTHNYSNPGVYNISFLPVNLINLVIDGNGITSVSQLPNTVKVLDISNNNLNSLYIDNLLNITYLNVTNNNLSTANVSNLINLTNLYCDGNNISSINLTNLTNLIDLNLSNNDLISLDFTNQENLTTLQCSNNNISTLIFDNTFTITYVLNYIDISHNNLSSLDFTNTQIGISYLDFSYNNVTSFYTIASISTLDCNNNNLTNLEFDNSTSLSFLNCSNNQLSILDIGFAYNLIQANISYNQLDTTNINNILINLQNNGLTNGQVQLNNQTPSACPSGDGILAEFYLIDVQGWTVTVDAGCSGVLRITFNTSYAYWFIAGSDIFDMYINWGDGSPTEHYITNYQEIPHSFLTSPATATIIFADNTLITQIDLSADYVDSGAYNNVTNITGLDILTNLQYLNLYGNLFSTFTSTLPSSLIGLSLSSNQLTSFNSTLPSSLISLSLSSNQLTSFNSTLPNSLSYLYLNNNQLTTFNSTLPNSITNLNLSYNQLTTFNSTLPNSITNLNLSYNQLTQTSFNNVLINLSGNGTSNGTVNLYYQTPSVCPTGNAIIAKNYLTNTLNWNVLIDLDCYPYIFEILFDTNNGLGIYGLIGGIPRALTTSAVDWGDGTEYQTYTNNNSILVHDYENYAGIKTIRFGLNDPTLFNVVQFIGIPGIIGVNNLNLLSSLNDIQIYDGTSLSQSSVNYILTTLSGMSFSNGYITLNNQTPLACPSGDGILAKNYLLGLNNTILTDECTTLTIDLDVRYAPGTSFGMTITGDTSFDLLFDWNDGTTSTYTGNNIIVNKSYSTIGSHNVTISVTGSTNIKYIYFISTDSITNLGQFDKLTNLNYLYVAEHKLTSLPTLPNSITYLNLQNNKFNSLAIENAINSFTGYSWTTPSIVLNQQRYPYNGCLQLQTPTYTNYQTLIGNGWEIFVDFCPYISLIVNYVFGNNQNWSISSTIGNFDMYINWGDGQISGYTGGNSYQPIHNYDSSGVYNIIFTFNNPNQITNILLSEGDITEISISKFVNLYGLNLGINYLTTLSGFGSENLQELYVNGNRLTTPAVNDILIELKNTTSYGAGTGSLSNQTPPACPTGDGLLALYYLTNVNQWIITTDTGCP